MSDFEDRLGRALSEGAQEAPGAMGVAEGARRRARRRRNRGVMAGAAAAVVAIALPVAVVTSGSGPGSTERRDEVPPAAAPELPRVACAGGPSWEVETMDGGLTDVVADADVREAFAGVLREAPMDAPSQIVEQGAERAKYIVLASSGDSYTLGLGSWTIDGPSPNAGTAGLSREPDGSLRMTTWGGCKRLEVEVPRGRIRVEITAPAGGVDRSTGEPVVVVTESDCTSGRDPLAYLDEPVVTEDDSRVVINLTSEAPVGGADCPGNPSVPLIVSLDAPIGDRELYDGSTFPPTPIELAPAPDGSDGGWQTVTYEGDPVNERGDNTVLIDLPAGWERLDTSGCDFAVTRFGLPENDPCEAESTLAIYGSALFDPCCPPGLADQATGGYAYSGALVGYVDASDYETARRILASLRSPADGDLDLARWTTETVDDIAVETPPGVDVGVEVVGGIIDGIPGNVGAQQRPDGQWRGTNLIGDTHLVRVTAPTEALALVVAASAQIVGSAGESSAGWETMTYDGSSPEAMGERIEFQVPDDWQQLDTSLCRIAYPRFGPPDSDPCTDDSAVTFFNAGTYGPGEPGLDGPDDTSGDKFLGRLVAHVEAPDNETANRILVSLRKASPPIFE